MRRVSSSSHPACVVLGGGRHAKVVIDALQAVGIKPHAVLDPDRNRWGSSLLGVPILGGDELLTDLCHAGVRHFAVGVGSTHDTAPRRRLYELAIERTLTPVTVRHPASVVSTWAELAPGVQLFAGAIVNPCAVVEVNAIVNTGAIVEHDCHIGAHAHLSPGVRLGGSVQVGEGAHIGIGATVRHGIRIGARAIVGAGAVVVEDVECDVVVMGVPARVHRRLAA